MSWLGCCWRLPFGSWGFERFTVSYEFPIDFGGKNLVWM